MKMFRQIALLMSLLTGASSAALAQLNTLSAASGEYRLKQQDQEMWREEIIWSEDFEAGIPSDWENAETSGVALWEYRGIVTTPNNEIGSIGSCIPEDAPGGAPILSPSWTNGFVIFDSNFWDNSENPCSPDFFGTGIAPGPHFATLTTPSLDLTGIDNVGLIFYQYIKDYQAETYVQVSVNQGTWQTVFENDLFPNESTPLDDMQRVVISGLADNQQDVRIRFVFEGTYYFWMLDDIQVVQLDDNNISARWSTYGDFDFYDLAHETGFEYMEYDQYPLGLQPELKFTTMADNFGAMAQTDVRLNVEIINTNTNTTVHTGQSSEGFVVPPGEEIELRAGDFQMPASIAKYDAVFLVNQFEEDEAPENNYDTLSFEISPVTYARDRGFTDAIFVSNEAYNGMPYEAGNVYLFETSGYEAHSITAGVAVGTSLPTQMYGAIYSFSIDETISYELLGVTEWKDVSESDLNNYGDEHVITMEFENPIDLPEGAYLVVAGTDAGADDFFFAASGSAYEFTSWVKYNSELLYLARTPMVRLNLGNFIGTVESEPQTSGFSVYPNPANDELFVQISNSIVSDLSLIKIMDASGRMVLEQSVFSGMRISVSALESGIYTATVPGFKSISFIKE
jgi:hypothetical protein